MLDRVITESELLSQVEDLGRERRLVGPVCHTVPGCEPPERYMYEEVSHARDLDLSFSYCVYSPKQFLFPAHESLFSFKPAGERGAFEATVTVDSRPMAFVGVHPCDVNAIRLLDKVFTDKQRDEHYLARRENTLIIAVDCSKPCTDGVFCKDMGGNEAKEGFDLMLYPLASANGDDRRYGVVFGTEQGRDWLLYGRKCETPTAADERAMADYQREKALAFPDALRTPGDALPDLLGRSYDSLLWDAMARRCYSCGSCNLSCPTCYCFNMYDAPGLDGKSGERKREWDGCQLSDFALVAGDHNFRVKAASRLRHRIYRKGKWVRELAGGIPGCVGCARCDRACTAKIASVDIYNQLAEEI